MRIMIQKFPSTLNYGHKSLKNGQANWTVIYAVTNGPKGLQNHVYVTKTKDQL